MSTFIDGGQVFAPGAKISPGDLRYSFGFGLFWSSPFGPLQLSIAEPLNSKPGDEIQRLQFTFGYGF
jgi:outer membrane protein insertion porin family